MAAEYLVSDRATNQILRYGTDGQLIGSLVGNDMSTNGGLFMPTTMSYGFGGDLFVSSFDLQTGDGRVLRYDANNGNFKGVFASGLIVPAGMAYHAASDTLLVGSLGANLGDSNQIVRIKADGNRLPDISLGPISGRTGMAVGGNGDLFVSSFAEGPFFTGSVLSYKWNQAQNTFELVGPFASNPMLAGANGLAFDSAGDLYVAGLFSQSVIRFDVEAGVVASSAALANLPYPSGLLIDPSGDILVTSLGNNNPNDPIYQSVFPGSVFRFNSKTGAPVGQVPFLTLGKEFQPTAILLRGLQGDFNKDGQLNAADIDALSSIVRESSNRPDYDLNGDALVNETDRKKWVEELKRTYFGDSNLDGVFDSSDLVAVFKVGQYEDAIRGNSLWSSGDWDGNADFTSTDLVVAFQTGAYEKGPRVAVAAVPEPSTGMLLLIGTLVGWLGRYRRR